MNLIRKRVYPQNENSFAEVVLYEWDRLEILPGSDDLNSFSDIHDLVDKINQYGYYSGIRLVKAAIVVFAKYCEDNEIQLHDKKFSIRYQNNIPQRWWAVVSGAIIRATFQCLMEFYKVNIPSENQLDLVIRVRAELRTTAKTQAV